MEKRQFKKAVWWKIGLLLLTVAAAVTKIYIGIDHDETYVTVLGLRLLKGDRMFDTMWELHMTSAVPVWLAAKFFYAVTGELAGLVIFLRYVSVLLQFAAAGVFYCIMKKYYRSDAVFLAAVAVANFLPRATQNLEYGLLEMLAMVLAMVLLYDVLRKREAQEKTAWGELVVAAVCYAAAVLAYPTVILSFPVLLVVLCACGTKKAGSWKLALVFGGSCALLAVLFLGVLFSYLSPAEFLENLKGILSDGTHGEGIVKTVSYGAQFVEVLKRSALFLGAAVGMYVIFHKWVSERVMIWYYLLAVMALILIGFNVTGIRPSGPMGLQVRYLVAAAATVAFYARTKTKDKLLFGLFWLTGIAVYLGTMYGSNMGIEVNASFLYLCLFMGLLLATEAAEDMEKYACTAGYLCVGLFVCSIIFTKGCLVRVTGTAPANIMESRVRFETGVLKGIWMYQEDADELKEKAAEIQEYSAESDNILYLGDEPVCNTFTEGDFTSATCISTPVYNEEWVQYYENEKHPQPTVIFVDKDKMETWEKFAETEFGSYLTEKYELTENELIEEEAFYILRL